MNELGITVIMASYLGEYPGSRSNPVQKFIRAVKSFQQQTLQEKQLIIVSDGCGLTNATYEDLFKSDPQITLIRFEKQEGWPGLLREAARSIAKYEWIMYLDSDDFYLSDYLEKILSIEKTNIDFLKIRKFVMPILNGELRENNMNLLKGKSSDSIKNVLDNSVLEESPDGKKFKGIVFELQLNC
jgi:glycosyltransferase involved in cell wall biosynthesis